MPYISVLYPKENKKTMIIPKNGLLIGRSDDCDFNIEDEYVSSRHCKIFYEGENFILEDLDSTNGTFINGTEVLKKNIIKDSQEFQIGITIIKVVK